jgi:hypothetical protein
MDEEALKKLKEYTDSAGRPGAIEEPTQPAVAPAPAPTVAPPTSGWNTMSPVGQNASAGTIGSAWASERQAAAPPASSWNSMPDPSAMKPPAGLGPIGLPPFGASGMSADQLARANGPQPVSYDEAKAGGVIRRVAWDSNRYTPPGMSEFESNARYNKEEGLRLYLNQAGAHRGGGGSGASNLSIPERIALTQSYMGIAQGYDAGDKLDLDRYTGIAKANDASLQTGVLQRGATVAERKMADEEKRSAYDMSKELQEQKGYDAKAITGTPAEAAAYLERRREMFPGLGNPGGPPAGGPPNPNAPKTPIPPISDSLKYARLFGSDTHAAAEKAGRNPDGTPIKTSDGAAATAVALFQSMKAQPGGERKYAENMDAIQKYLAQKHGDRSVDQYVNPGFWSQGFSAMGNTFGKPSDAEVLQSMMRAHNLTHGTPAQQKSARRSKSHAVTMGMDN